MLKSQKGFTLLELIIVVAILGVFFGMATVRVMDTVANNNLKWAAEQMAIDIRTMQELSLQKSATSTLNVTMTITSNTYQINNLGTQLSQITMPTNVTIAVTGDSPLTYDPYVFANNKENMIILTSGVTQQTRTIVLCKETGRIRIDSSNPAVYKGVEK